MLTEDGGGPLMHEKLAEAEEQVREARRQLASLLNSIHGFFYRCALADPWKMSFVSNGVKELTGYRKEVLEQKLSWAELMHPDDVERVGRAVEAAVASGKAFTIEYRITHRSGETRWVQEQGQAIYGPDEEPLYLEGIITDTTDQKQLELSLHAALEAQSESARHWREMLDIIPQMVWTVGPNGEDHYNDRWIQFTGVALSDFSRTETVHPDDRERALAAWTASKASGSPYQCEYRLRHKSGQYRWILSRGHPQKDAKGNVTGWYGTCTDIHERVTAQEALHESESRFRRILDSLPHNVWSMAAGETSPDYYNRGWYEFTGLPPGSLTGPSWDELYHPDDYHRIRQTWRRSCETRERYECEYRLRGADGEYRWVLSKGKLERGPGGEKLRWYGTCTDVHENVLAREALRRSERRVNTILDTIPQIIWAANASGEVDFLSRQSLGFFGEVLPNSGQGWLSVVHPDDRERASSLWRACVDSGSPLETEFRVRHRSGDYVWTLVRSVPERDGDGRIVRWFGTCTDINERVLAQQAMLESEALSRSMIEASPDCIKLLDLEGVVVFINDAGAKAMELHDRSDIVGRRWTEFLRPESREGADAAFESARAGELGHLTMFLPTMTGTPKWWDVVATPVPGNDGSPARILVISRDITRQKRTEEQVTWGANHDSLTSLPNRALFQSRVEAAIEDAQATNGNFALLLLDVDNFKQINDTLGHDAGDTLLCGFAERLRAAARADDLVARLGGDEFAVLLTGIGSAQEVKAAVDNILTRLREPCLYNGRILDCQASIGASIYPLHGSDRAALLKSADIALYAAKGAGRANLKLFQPKMRRDLQLRASMLNLARDALNEDRILPFYQPKVDLRSGFTSGFEALLRWEHSGRGIQTPAAISAAFEDMDLAGRISGQMIDRVIADMRRWLDDGVDFDHVAINAAAAEFRSGDFAERLLERLDRARIPPRHVQLEVTETVFLGRGSEYVERALKTLSEAGVQIALDDFGTGYASLSHLKQFPVDVIKIDRSFVRDFELFPDDAAIIKAVISLGQSLSIKVVAEGIEKEDQHRFLLKAGCECAQGYLYGRAAPAEEVPLVVSARRHMGRAA